ncbi:MAG: TatD family hydrolase [Myxococcota bacterium]
MWLDSHCHVTADRFDADREDVLERARQAGVETLIAIGSGYGIEGSRAAVELARDREDVFATAGVHPHDADQLDDAGRSLQRQWLAEPKVMAVGECGLDYHYMNSPREAQRSVFAEQVALAREIDLPVSIHVRGDGPEAYDELLDIWIQEGAGDVEGVLHCYTGTKEFAHRALDHRFVVSFSGIVTFKQAGDLREVAASLPVERVLIETDAPFLAPEGHRGRRNEPAWVTVVGETLAAVQGRSIEEVARQTSENARRFYRLPRDPG